MSWISLLSVLPIHPATAAEYRERLRGVVEEGARVRGEGEQVRRWLAGAEPGLDAFLQETLEGPLDGVIEVVYEVWNAGHVVEAPHLAVTCRKACPASALAWALGPDRWSLLPGWFGDYLLSPDEVAAALPAVERAFSWMPEERERAERRLREALLGEATQEDVDALLDGIPPVWRAAAAQGHALLGANLLPS